MKFEVIIITTDVETIFDKLFYIVMDESWLSVA